MGYLCGLIIFYIVCVFAYAKIRRSKKERMSIEDIQSVVAYAIYGAVIIMIYSALIMLS